MCITPSSSRMRYPISVMYEKTVDTHLISSQIFTYINITMMLLANDKLIPDWPLKNGVFKIEMSLFESANPARNIHERLTSLEFIDGKNSTFQFSYDLGLFKSKFGKKMGWKRFPVILINFI